MEASLHGRNTYIDSNPNVGFSLKLTCKWTLQQVFICLRPPPLLGFCLGWYSNFLGSESGQKQSVTPAEYGLSLAQLYNPPNPPSHTLSDLHDIQYVDFGRWGGGGREEPKTR
jgi:hypothetical protein